MRLMVFLFLAVVFSAGAQHTEQPLKESSEDIRGLTALFSIEVLNEEKTYLLERTPNEDYFLRMRFKRKDTLRKISSKEAKKMDMDFASRFLRCQYEIPKYEKKCVLTLRLKMKGEDQEICHKDEKKSQEMTPFIKNLSKHFSNGKNVASTSSKVENKKIISK